MGTTAGALLSERPLLAVEPSECMPGHWGSPVMQINDTRTNKML